MQAVRRSNRLRNRIVRTPERERGRSEPIPNLRNMGGDQHNINENVRRQAEIIPDLGDLIPNEQGDARFLFHGNNLRRDDENIFISILTTNLYVRSLIFISIIILILFISEFLTTMLIGEYPPILKPTTNSIQSSYFEEPLKCPLPQNYVNVNIKELKRKFNKLNKDIEMWKKNITKEIEEALALYDADKIGMIDYALESAGGHIDSIPDTIPFPSHLSYDIMGLVNINYPSNPRLIIQPGNLPGQCFAFKGQIGKIHIQLAQTIQITAVTIEHAHKNLVEDINSAPKDFKVYGLEAGDDSIEKGEELGAFTYRLDLRPLQTFYLQNIINKKSYKYVALHILSNYGNEEYTCVYRFRVHGIKVNESV